MHGDLAVPHQAVRRVRHVGAVGVLAELAAPPAGCRLQAEGGRTRRDGIR